MEKTIEEKIIKVFFGEYSVEELKDIINSGVVLKNYAYNNTKLKNFIVKLESNAYREIINCLIPNNMMFAQEIEKDRYEYLKDRFDSIDDNGIFKDLYDKTYEELDLILPRTIIKKINCELNRNNSINYLLKTYTTKCLHEYIVDLYFKDITFNFLYNVKTILRYVVSAKKDIIPKERLILYKNILDFYNLSLEEKKNLFYNYDENKKYLDDFYTDFNNCKSDSYKSINSCIINNNSLKDIYNEKLSKNYGVNIYELDGEDFYLYAHCSKIDSNLKEFPFKKNTKNKTLSISLIGKDNISVYNPINEYIVLGFNYLEPNNIIHLFNSDSYTNRLLGTIKFQRIYTPKELLENTYGYNEILYKTNNTNIYPFCIICFDEIKPIELFFAKLEKLPIIKICKSKYRKSYGTEDRLENNYLDYKKAKEIEFYSVYF